LEEKWRGCSMRRSQTESPAGVALAEILIGGLGFLLLRRLRVALVAFVLRCALVLIVLGLADAAFDSSMSDPCIPERGDRFLFGGPERCEQNLRYTFYASVLVLGAVASGSAVWVWRSGPASSNGSD
jgi:hypothetical protein